MKQKKIGNILYVFDTTAYQITEDTDAAVIKIQLECIPAFELLNESLKDKFEPINYKLYCVKHPEWADYLDDYTVSVSVTGNGAVSASPTSGDEGEEITLTVTPESGYELNTMTATSGDTAITITDNKFTMPAGNVTVTATFQGHEFDITCAEAQNGTVSAPSTARLGDTVTITTTPADNYRLDTLTVMCGDVPVTVTNNTFTMPAGDVTITATFVAIDYANEYFTIESVEDLNGITIRTESEKTFEVSLDGGATWIQATGTYSTSPRYLDQYDRLLVRATGDTFTYTDNNDIKESIIISEKDIKIYGNIMSLLYGSSFANQTSFPADTVANFQGLFKNCGDIRDAKHLILPATSLTKGCYDSMFERCVGLNAAPELPATTLANSCYQNMFKDCISLVTAPVLPATTLANSCYYLMFSGCTSLTTAPALPATTLANNCYASMFSSCTLLTNTPILGAENVVKNAYQLMFNGCTSIDEVVMLGTSIYSESAENPFINWLNGTAGGTIYKNPNWNPSDWPAYFAPSGWTVEDYTPSV